MSDYFAAIMCGPIRYVLCYFLGYNKKTSNVPDSEGILVFLFYTSRNEEQLEPLCLVFTLSRFEAYIEMFMKIKFVIVR